MRFGNERACNGTSNCGRSDSLTGSTTYRSKKSASVHIVSCMRFEGQAVEYQNDDVVKLFQSKIKLVESKEFSHVLNIVEKALALVYQTRLLTICEFEILKLNPLYQKVCLPSM